LKGFLLVAALFIASCASIPMQESYALSVEKRLQASENWKVLAKEIAREVEESVEKQSEGGNGPYLSKTLKEEHENNNPGPVFISDFDQSPFGRAMRTIITTELIKHKVAITRDANTSFRLDWLVQPVVHKAERKNSPSFLYIILVGVPQAIFFGEADFGFQSKPHTELIITFRLKKNDLDIFRQTHIYSINDADIDHYWDISE
jgi:hypothetical protein